MSDHAKGPLIIAHRGSSSAAPENTLAAFALAIADGADGIEFDVQLSTDGIPAVIHDLTLTRTAGLRKAVTTLRFKELSELDVGSWFNRKCAHAPRPEYARERIPTLNQVFSLVKRKRHLKIYVEMKTAQNDHLSSDLARSVVASIQQFDFHNRAIVISFNLPTLAAVKELDPAIRTGALFGRRPRLMLSPRAMIARALDCRASEVALHHTLVTRHSMNLALKNNLSVVLWTTDDPEWYSRARDMGIYAVMTNDPAEMILNGRLRS